MVGDNSLEKKKELQEEIKNQKKEIRENKKELTEHKKQVKELVEQEKRIRKHLENHAKVYVSEMKKALSTAILAAFAFLMALSWREYLTEIIDSIVQYSPVKGKFISALLVTLVSVIGIIIVTRTLTPEQN